MKFILIVSICLCGLISYSQPTRRFIHFSEKRNILCHNSSFDKISPRQSIIFSFDGYGHQVSFTDSIDYKKYEGIYKRLQQGLGENPFRNLLAIYQYQSSEKLTDHLYIEEWQFTDSLSAQNFIENKHDCKNFSTHLKESCCQFQVGNCLYFLEGAPAEKAEAEKLLRVAFLLKTTLLKN